MTIVDRVIAGYAAQADATIAPYDALDPAQVLAPVADLFIGRPLRILEIAAGTGRDAAWLAGQGHRVLAVEPVAAFRTAGQRLHPDPRIDWLDDRLPELPHTTGIFDRVLLVAVWQHLDPPARAEALKRLATFVADDGRLAMSLRHGAGAPDRETFAAPPEETIAAAAAAGLTLVRRVTTDSVSAENRAAGVRWTWLVFVPA